MQYPHTVVLSPSSSDITPVHYHNMSVLRISPCNFSADQHLLMHGKIDNQIKPFSLNCVTAKDGDGNVKRVFFPFWRSNKINLEKFYCFALYSKFL